MTPDRMILEDVVCGVCGSDRVRVLFARESDPHHGEAFTPTTDVFQGYGRVVECSDCGVARLSPRPAPAYLRKAYRDSADPLYLSEHDGRLKSAHRVMRILERHVRPGRLLDVGCGAGVLLAAARGRWKAEGVEMSAWAAGEARANTGCTVFEGSIEESALPEGAYDAVTMLDLIEHVPDPMSTVASAARLLRPGGALFVLTPDLGAPVARLMRSWWWGLRPAHLHYFSRANLTAFLEKSGFAVVEVRRLGRWFTLGYWISRLTGYSPWLAALAGKLAKMVLIEHLPVYVNTLDSVGILAIKKESLMKEGKKIVAVLPAYNAEKTLERTLADIPKGLFDELILVDDASKDGTVELARRLGGLTVVVHEKNRGYGGNQKTCYKTALSMGADVVVMIHPDYQYDPTLAPEMVAPILQGKADCVLGSRMMRDTALKGKMPVWKYVGNKFLTGLENLGFGAKFSEYHTGYRAYTKRVLSSLQLELNSDGFVFDQEIIAQMLAAGYRIVEVPIPTRYFKEASSVGFWVSVKYGLLTLWLLARYRARRWFRLPIRQFQLLE